LFERTETIDHSAFAPRVPGVSHPMTAPAPLVTREDFRCHLAELRAVQGLPASLSSEIAETVAAVFLRRRQPARVIAMRRLSQRCGNSGIEAA
jgi:hypothetical protein